MSYPRLFKELPTQRFVGVFTARAAAANYHGARIARLLALKLGTRPRAILPFLPKPLAREAARELYRGRARSASAFLEMLLAEERGDE